jgi:hypothetical protein
MTVHLLFINTSMEIWIVNFSDVIMNHQNVSYQGFSLARGLSLTDEQTNASEQN